MNSPSTSRRSRRSLMANGIAVAACLTGTALVVPQAAAAVLAAPAAGTPAPRPATDPLLLDGGFELAVVQDGKAIHVGQDKTGWKTNRPGGSIEVWRGAYGLKPHSGSQNVELDASVKEDLYQDVAVTPGAKLHLSLWFKPRYKGDGKEHMLASVTPQGKSKQDVKLDRTQETSGEWTRYAGTYTVPADVSQIRLELRPMGEGHLVDSVVLQPEPTVRTSAVVAPGGGKIIYTSAIEVPAGGSFTGGSYSAQLPEGTKLVEASVKGSTDKPAVSDKGLLSLPVGARKGGEKLTVSFEVAVQKDAKNPFVMRPALDYEVANLGKQRLALPPVETGVPTADLSVSGAAEGKDKYRVKVTHHGGDTTKDLTVKAVDADAKSVEFKRPEELKSGGVWELEIPSGSPTLKVSVESAAADPNPDNNSKLLNRDGGGSDDPDAPSQEADLSVKLTADTDKPAAGKELTYTVTVANAGELAAKGNKVTVDLPKGFTPKLPDGATSKELPDGKGTQHAWAIGDLEPEGTTSIALRGTVPSGAEELRASVSVSTASSESALDDNKAELGLKVGDASGDGSGSDGSLALTGAGGVALLGVGGAAAVGAGAWALMALRRRNALGGR
ncbi:hypothetical protein [Streptomyces sp. NPDC059918]|uniref:hypothetical protein n=1 Tax=unclassified Streptomyces TaxID=2593676 RepID=UPI0036501E60